MNRTIRTFVAVETSVEVQTRARQLIDRLATANAKVRWVDGSNLHFTLKFLGDVELLEIPAVCEAVTKAVSALPPFEIEARGAGAFPDVRRPRTVWLGVSRGTEEMVALHSALEAGLLPLGFRREQRRFRPHITIGRVRGPQAITQLAQLVAKEVDFMAGIVSVDEVVVFSSDPGPEGPCYEPLATAKLEGT